MRRRKSRPPDLGLTKLLVVSSCFVGHQRDVPGGDLWAYTAGGFSRGQKSTTGRAGVWTGARVTVRKMLGYSIPPGYRRKEPPKRPKLGPWVGVIDAILEEDKQRPAKQRHTAKRIFDRLRAEHAFTGDYNAAVVPTIHTDAPRSPGRRQVIVGAITFILAWSKSR